ncbi:MAG: hypothetical protein WAM66_07905 [Acidobacteriaceae bacterium]
MKMPKIFAVLLLGLCCCPLPAQDARNAVRQVVNNELAADKADRSRWMYYEVDVKPNKSVKQWVAQTSHGNVNRVVERNGHPIPKPQQRKNVGSFIHNSNERAQLRQNDQKDATQAEQLLRMLPDAFLWSFKSKTTDTITYHFKPDPSFNPPSRQARVFAAMEGDMTVNTDQLRIQHLKGTMIHDVNFGWGILGSLKKGGWFEVNRIRTAPDIWQINVTHVHIQGRALLFKTISEQEDDTLAAFSRLPDDITLEQAAEEVMKQPNKPE